MSEQAEELIKGFEGLRLKAYQDTGGVWTVGWGHTGADVTPGLQISIDRAEQLLRQDIATKAVAPIFYHITVPLNDNQMDALTSLVFNEGSKPLCMTLGAKLNAQDYAGAANEFDKWVYGHTINGMEILPGLVKRRAAEKKVFLTPIEG